MASDSVDILSLLNGLLHEGGIDTYLTFFRKRIEIEDEYHASLSKLASRQQEIERRFEGERVENTGGSGFTALSAAPESVRKAWKEIAGNLAQEASLRKQWVQRIRSNVIEPLEKFRGSKDRTLSRIREELRSSFSEHKDYSATVQRLKKSYDRKCEEVQQFYVMQEAAEFREKMIEESARAAGTTGLPTSRGSEAEWEHVGEHTSPVTSDREGGPPSFPPRKSIESSALSVAPGMAGAAPAVNAHSRPQFLVSGATSSALKDTATPAGVTPLQARSNEVLNALRSNTNNFISRLNARKDRPGGPSFAQDESMLKPSTLKAVKLKRDAEDADRDYRKAVFHLDTLRLRKEQVIRGARRASEEIVFEMAGETKETFGYYVDETRIAAIQRISICDHAQHLVDKINPEDDATLFAHSLPPDYVEPRVLYENAYAGPCRSLLFGVALTDYVASNPAGGLVPKLVKMCVDELDARGLKTEGIYRVSGKMATVTQVVHEIEKDETRFRFTPEHDIHTISSVFKLYLRQLPTPLFAFPLADRLAFSRDLEEHQKNGYAVLAKRMRRLPPAHQATLKLLCEHLARVNAHSEQNKMNASNIGLVFSPAVFGEDTSSQQLPAQAWKDPVMEMLIAHHETLCEGLPHLESSTPSRQPRRSFGAARPVSPAARKSLEADRYESYSRSVSPSRAHLEQPPIAPDVAEGMERLRCNVNIATSPPQGYQPLYVSPHPAMAKGSSPKRHFSLRKRSAQSVSDAGENGGSEGGPSRRINGRPETVLLSGPEYSLLPVNSEVVGGKDGLKLPPGAAPPQPHVESLPTTPIVAAAARSEEMLATLGAKEKRMSAVSLSAGQEQKRAASG